MVEVEGKSMRPVTWVELRLPGDDMRLDDH
jgi:hypothetical protein